VVDALPLLEVVGHFTWMEVTPPRFRDAGPGPQERNIGWLQPSDFSEVEALLQTAFPSSRARPGVPGVRRWAGLRTSSGELAAVAADAADAADALSCPQVGFVSGVVTLQRSGPGGSAPRSPDSCCGRCSPNTRASAWTYRSLGMSPRPLALASYTAQHQGPGQ